MPKRPTEPGDLDIDVQEIFDLVQGSGVLPHHVTDRDAVANTLTLILRRISGGERRDVIDDLPEPLQQLVRSDAMAPGEQPQLFDKDEFLRQLAGALRVSEDQAEEIAREVFSALQHSRESDNYADLETQLPPDLKQMWHG